MGKYFIIMLLVFNLGFAQHVQTTDDYLVFYTADVYSGILPDGTPDDSLLSAPATGTLRSVPYDISLPGSSCFPSANKVEILYTIATTASIYRYYEVASGYYKYLGKYENAACNNTGIYTINFPKTITCGSYPGGVNVCWAATFSSGATKDVVLNAYGGSSAHFTWSREVTYVVHPNLMLKEIGYSSYTSPNRSVTLYQYTDIPFLGLETHEPAGFKIYPNPASSYFTISNPNFDNIKSLVVVYDAFGKLVTDEKLDIQDKVIDISQYSTGLYILLIKDQNNNILHVEKIVKR
ncbi:MAG: T9SS type A sorting domain-containing protein [Bacteroidetes bacterium]|nr:T9SS type A sorting domain-containing protein [Bacteroidota bacterium]